MQWRKTIAAASVAAVISEPIIPAPLDGHRHTHDSVSAHEHAHPDPPEKATTAAAVAEQRPAEKAFGLDDEAGYVPQATRVGWGRSSATGWGNPWGY